MCVYIQARGWFLVALPCKGTPLGSCASPHRSCRRAVATVLLGYGLYGNSATRSRSTWEARMRTLCAQRREQRTHTTTALVPIEPADVKALTYYLTSSGVKYSCANAKKSAFLLRKSASSKASMICSRSSSRPRRHTYGSESGRVGFTAYPLVCPHSEELACSARTRARQEAAEAAEAAEPWRTRLRSLSTKRCRTS